MDVVVILRSATLLALGEHSTSPTLGGAVRLSETESAVLLEHDTLARLLERAGPKDRTLDDLLLRIAR
jgi:hypothetical protein